MLIPVEQLLCNRIPIIVGQEVYPLVVEAKVTHQPLNDAGLLKDGVVVGPRLVTEPEPYKIQSNHPVETLGQSFPYLAPVVAGGGEAMQEDDNVRAAHSTSGISIEDALVFVGEESSRGLPGEQRWGEPWGWDV